MLPSFHPYDFATSHILEIDKTNTVLERDVMWNYNQLVAISNNTMKIKIGNTI
jgi:hypothetical protein